MAEEGTGARQAFEDRLTRGTGLLAVAGAALMIAVALMVTVSVGLRWFGRDGISGVVELVEIGTALAVFAFLPLCQARRGNVVVDTFTAWMPERARAGLDALWDLVYAAVAGLIAWQLLLGAQGTLSSRTTSMVLGLPTGYAIAACALMAGALALVAAATAVRLMRG